MATKTINVEMLARMFVAGAQNIEAKKEYINELNVFPVPYGDTGTNMSLTIMAAAKEVTALDKPDMKSLAKAISSGSLRGARGNSGVILSQLLRGFTKVIKTETEINAATLAAAFQKAVETAYKAVMKPKEGTILTVARGGAERAVELLEENPDIPVVLTGGQGYGEEVTEARCMYDWLTARGVDPERLILEERAGNTAENFAFSKELFKERGIDPGLSRVAVVTNDFHIARSRLIAAREGYGYAFGVPARLPWLHLEVNYYLREAFAMVKTLLFD